MYRYIGLILAIFALPLQAQWQEENSLTDNTQCDMTPDAAMFCGNPKVLWICEDSVFVTSYEIGEWSPQMRLNPDTIGYNRNPAITLDHLVWQGVQDSMFGTYYQGYGDITRVAESVDSLGNPEVTTCLCNYYIWIVWEGFDGNDYEIFARGCSFGLLSSCKIF
ncbi:hypothetical protein CH333_04055 [candidate division WOR-3 bacterium JGI_Cruoil_03_44_89]|uniref:Uncharacterized protein n=1 Tax=candidate division WOR-3 bacterium JGI_Cruoil_03_44_89 TaxID=1973748 RepID=A0A235BVB4_UNCW3|nr:MAG: hypothetical protein CH333_04055 [candidate division WOR-3 bacterium JGI_Cruoil_03_44_89]